MTWESITDITEGGSGAVEYRIAIEGFDYSFVTSQDMANNSSTVKRINGLLRQGIKVSQNVKFPEAKIDINTNNFTVVDYQEKATEAFYRKPTFSTTLAEDLQPNDIFLIVSSLQGIRLGMLLWIGSECVIVNGIFPDTSVEANRHRVLISRGVLGTTPQAHYTQTSLGDVVKPIVQNIPFTIERRRAYLYAYGKGDDLQGEGTLIWRGIVLTQPRFEGTKYTFEVGPITELLKCQIGIDAPSVPLRGLNFGCYKWAIKVEVLNSANVYSDDVLTSFDVFAQGFYENIYELASNLNNQLESATLLTTYKAGCSVTTNGELVFTQFHTNATINALRFKTIFNPIVDKNLNAEIHKTFEIDNEYVRLYISNIIFEKDYVVNLQQNKQYVSRLKIGTPFPKQFTIYRRTRPLYEYSQYLNSNLDFGKRLYLNYGSEMTFINNIAIEDSEGNIMSMLDLSTDVSKDISFNTTERYLVTNLVVPRYNRQIIDFVIYENDHKLIFGFTLGFESNYGTAVAGLVKPYNVVDFLEALTIESPYNTSNGIINLITENDIDIDDMRAQFNKISAKPYQNDRRFIFWKKSDTLENILNEEFKLLGCYMALTEDGKITMRRLRNVNPYEEPDTTFNSDDILTDNSYPTIETNKFGIWNSIKISTYWDASQEKFKGPTIVQNNIESIAIYGRAKQITIEPKSQTMYSPTNITPFIDDLKDIMLRATGLFSRDYWVVNFDVPIKYFDLPIGSVVRIINKQLPNYTPNFSFLTSRRGSGRILGTLVAKTFDLDKGFGSVSILVSDQEYAGTDIGQKAIYAPDALTTTSRTNLGGGFWNVTLDSNYAFYLPEGTTQEDWWNVGDAVRFDRFDNTVKDTGYGRVVAISGTGNSITLTINFNNGGTVPTNFSAAVAYMMKTADINFVYTTENQTIYAFNDSGTLGSDNTNYPNGNLNRIISF